MRTLLAKRNSTAKDLTPWRDRHDDAVKNPRVQNGESIAMMLQAWALYAAGYKARYGSDSVLGNDYVLGEAWKNIGLELRTLLNGECGRLDCGTLDAFILDTMRDAGIDTENL